MSRTGNKDATENNMFAATADDYNARVTASQLVTRQIKALRNAAPGAGLTVRFTRNAYPTYDVADTAINIHGNTYSHRAALKAHGFKWDPSHKCWYLVAHRDSEFDVAAIRSDLGI